MGEAHLSTILETAPRRAKPMPFPYSNNPSLPKQTQTTTSLAQHSHPRTHQIPSRAPQNRSTMFVTQSTPRIKPQLLVHSKHQLMLFVPRLPQKENLVASLTSLEGQ
jgi:hypothetical protein